MSIRKVTYIECTSDKKFKPIVALDLSAVKVFEIQQNVPASMYKVIWLFGFRQTPSQYVTRLI